MGYRNEDGSWHDSCLDKLHPGEPFFVLRAQDRLAPSLVELWVELATRHGLSEAKQNEALDTAVQMRDWPSRKFPD